MNRGSELRALIAVVSYRHSSGTKLWTNSYGKTAVIPRLKFIRPLRSGNYLAVLAVHSPVCSLSQGVVLQSTVKGAPLSGPLLRHSPRRSTVSLSPARAQELGRPLRRTLQDAARPGGRGGSAPVGGTWARVLGPGRDAQ